MDFDTRLHLNSKKNVVVIEDEEINRELLSAILENDYNVIPFGNGKEALDFLSSTEEEISIIMCDLLMPIMDGYTFLKLKSDDVKLKDIPVIVITSEKESEVECLKLGAIDFISKPFEAFEVILARVERLIELYEKNIIIKRTREDELTGLLNFEYFTTYAEQLLKNNASFDIMALRIGNYDIVLDMLGRTHRDELLKKVGELLREYALENKGFASRDHDDAFFLMIPPTANHLEIMNGFNQILKENYPNLYLVLNAGIYPNLNKKVKLELSLILDRLMQCCKMIVNDNDRIINYYNEEYFTKNIHKQELIASFEEGIKNQEFAIYFQPKYNIKGNQPVLAGAEALVRWKSNKLGFVSPGEFIPLFEDNGLIRDLDEYVFNRVCEIKKELIKEGYKVPPISVNLSRIDFYDQGLIERILNLVNFYHLNPQDINIEVTESAYIKDTQQLIDTIEKIRNKGFKIEIDDFGSGYSALNMIAEVSFDVLKLDMLFMKNFDTNEKVRRIIASTLYLASSIGAKVVAEGVETKEQFDYLKENGADMIQGYYLSRPLPLEDFSKLLDRE